MRLKVRAIIFFTLICIGCSAKKHGGSSIENTGYSTEVFYSGVNYPWGMDFLPGGELLVTEKSGRLLRISKTGDRADVITGVPQVKYKRQGGLLDIAVDPQFSKNRLVYLSYSEQDKELSGTAVARGKLTGKTLEEVTVIWRQTPKVKSNLHWGSRLVFKDDGTLFITTGDRYYYKDQAQDLSSTLGKTIRINTDGSIPKDNPYVGLQDKSVRSDIWSYGHRNIQGAAIHPESQKLWTHEHGAKGGDEINLDQKGKNYGWPVITHGVDYTGLKIGEGTHKKGMEQPLHYWVPSIAPSGMLFYKGSLFPEWKNNLFIGSLKFSYLNKITLKNNRVVSEEKLLSKLGNRVRDIAEGPDGAIYVAFDQAKSSLIRIIPKSKASN